MTPRLTARARLALLHTTLVIASGLVLVGLTYLLLRQRQRFEVIKVDHSDTTEAVPDLPDLPALAGQQRDQLLSEFVFQATIALGAVAVLTAALSWWMAGRILRPIRAISSTAQRLSAENLSERMPTRDPADELTALAKTINGMLDRIQRGMGDRDRMLESQKMFVANAAHELRTPLTTMRAAIDVTVDGEPTKGELLTMTADIRTAVAQSQRTLDGLLILARSQRDLATTHPVDLAEVATRALDGAETAIQDGRLSLETSLSPACVNGAEVLLDRMIGNLVDNAVRYNQEGGRVVVETGKTPKGEPFLRISNTGRRLSPDTVDKLAEPFNRGSQLRTPTTGGSGLGLSIVRAIVAAHRGELAILARPTGGLEITARFHEATSS
jgi:signal transduction histidine kinase